MSARLRSTPRWEQCEDSWGPDYQPQHPDSWGIPRHQRHAGLGHKLELQGHVNPEDPDGIFFATCPYCVRAATRRRRLAQAKIVIVLDYLQDEVDVIINWEQDAYMKMMHDFVTHLHDIDLD